jgi:hypothetical protein
MDWIEQWFGFAPDNGEGSVELLIMIAAAAVVATAVAWYRPKSRAAIVRFLARMGVTRPM